MPRRTWQVPPGGGPCQRLATQRVIGSAAGFRNFGRIPFRPRCDEELQHDTRERGHCNTGRARNYFAGVRRATLRGARFTLRFAAPGQPFCRDAILCYFGDTICYSAADRYSDCRRTPQQRGSSAYRRLGSRAVAARGYYADDYRSPATRQPRLAAVSSSGGIATRERHQRRRRRVWPSTAHRRPISRPPRRNPRQ